MNRVESELLKRRAAFGDEIDDENIKDKKEKSSKRMSDAFDFFDSGAAASSGVREKTESAKCVDNVGMLCT